MNSNQEHNNTSADNSTRKARIHRMLISCVLFKSATAATIEAALNAASFDALPRGKYILQQGTPSQGLALLARGRARVERSLLLGDVLPLGYRGAGDVAGESTMAGAVNYTENVVAMDDCDIVRIPAETMQAILQSDPAVMQTLVNILLQQRVLLEERVKSLLFRPVEGRVVEFLLNAANRWGVDDTHGTLISAPLTHLEIANAIGSTRETVTVTLSVLRRDGLLTTQGRRLIVIDRDALSMRK